MTASAMARASAGEAALAETIIVETFCTERADTREARAVGETPRPSLFATPSATVAEERSEAKACALWLASWEAEKKLPVLALSLSMTRTET